MPPPAMPGMEREAAEPVEHRLAAVDLDRQRIMRPVADDDVGAGVDRGMRDLAHVVEHLLAETPMARRDDDVGLSPQRRDVLGKSREIGAVTCFFSQHSPILGQPASSHTVCRPLSRMMRCVSK